MSMLMEIPAINLDVLRNLDCYRSGRLRPEAVIQLIQECERAVEGLIHFGALFLRDSRVAEEDNETFLDLMEDYFNQPLDDLRKDERLVLGRILGYTERQFSSVDEGCPNAIVGTAKSTTSSRHISAFGTPSASNIIANNMSKFVVCKDTNAPSETPTLENLFSDLPSNEYLRERWPIRKRWGQYMMDAVEDLVDMIEIGLKLRTGTFKEVGRFGPHILSSNSTNLDKHGQRGKILTKRHTDLNFLTIHGRSRFPSLDIWTRNGQRFEAVKIREGYNFFVQAGKQLEHFTGGLIKAGYHEVIVNEQTLVAMEQWGLEFPGRPPIRVSSTLFWHLPREFVLVPISELKDRANKLRAKNLEAGLDEGDEEIYEPIKVEEQICNEIEKFDA